MKPYGVNRNQTQICQEARKCKTREHCRFCDSDTLKGSGKDGRKFAKAKERRRNKIIEISR